MKPAKVCEISYENVDGEDKYHLNTGDMKLRDVIAHLAIASAVVISDYADKIKDTGESLLEPEQALDDVLKEAANAIYFADSADYMRALWTIVRRISPETAKLLEKGKYSPCAEEEEI